MAGGSIAGLCAGSALLAAGFDVHVFERSVGRLSSRGAGIVVQPELMALLSAIDAPPLTTTRCRTRRTIAGTSGKFQEAHMPQRFTSWEAIYASLRDAFPEERYHSGKTIQIVENQTSGVLVRANGDDMDARLLVAADGFRSAIRSSLTPETTTQYAGYIAWRGVVDEADLSDEIVDFFDDTFSFCITGNGGHALCYFIPGDGLVTERGARRLNWVWYTSVDEGDALNAIMTDRNGKQRKAAVPQGLVNANALEAFHYRTAELDDRFAQIVQTTRDPFIQAIVDIAPPAMVFGRVCLLGDAAFVVRPHTAAAASKAAADASALAHALRNDGPDIGRALTAWQQARLPIGQQLVNYGVALGERSQRQGAR